MRLVTVVETVNQHPPMLSLPSSSGYLALRMDGELVCASGLGWLCTLGLLLQVEGLEHGTKGYVEASSLGLSEPTHIVLGFTTAHQSSIGCNQRTLSRFSSSIHEHLR